MQANTRRPRDGHTQDAHFAMHIYSTDAHACSQRHEHERVYLEGANASTRTTVRPSLAPASRFLNSTHWHAHACANLSSHTCTLPLITHTHACKRRRMHPRASRHSHTSGRTRASTHEPGNAHAQACAHTHGRSPAHATSTGPPEHAPALACLRAAI
jgi:hypothetical protein